MEGRKMPEEILPLDEADRVAKEFVRAQWNAEVTDIKSILLSSDRSLYEVEGKAKMPHRVATGEPKRLPNNAPFYETDVVYMECLFKLQISAKNGKVVGYGKNNIEQAPPYPPTGAVLEEMRWERELKDKPDSVEDLAKKYGIDRNKFKL